MKTTTTSLFCLGTLLALLCCVDTAQAQTTTLSANPLQITFNTQPGVTPPPQTLLISSSNGQVNATVATTNNPWLFVSPLGGATPLSITVSVVQGAPSSGTDVGFINISAPGAAVLSVQVTLNVNSQGGASPLSTNPNSLSFAFPANSTVPASKNVTVSSTDSSVTSFSTTVTTNNTGNWLTVSPGSGSLPNTLQITVNPTALSGSGPFNAAIAISAPGTTGLSLPVLVTVGGTPSIKVDPVQFSFAYQIGTSPAPAAQTLSITSSTGANVSFTATPKTASCGINWLVLTQQNGATPASVGVQVNTSGLQAGNCSGEIDISAPGASNPNVVVPVSLLVSANPLLQVPTTGPTFTYQIGGNTQLATQNVQITSSTPGLSFTATATLVSGPNFLTVTPANGVTPQSLALTANSAILASLGPGTYSETVTIVASGAGNSPQSFPVTLIVSSNPILNANVAALNFNYQVNLTPPQSQIVTLTSTGAPLNFQVAANTNNCSGFLVAPPSTGVTFGSQNQVLVAVNVAGLTTSQTCTGNITVTVPGSSNQLVIPVTLNVSTTALLNVSQQAINVSAIVGAAATTQLVSVTSTDPNNPLNFAATAATNPSGLTWLAVTPNSGSTPNNLQITINPINLQPGTYTGAITVSATNVPSQIIPVTLTIFSSSIAAAPASFAFTQSFGGPQPASQTAQISGVPAGTTVGAVTSYFSGAGWLAASVAGNVLTVTANGASLGQGTYLGVVTVIVPGGQNSPLYVPVTLTIGPAQSLSVSPNQLSFNLQAGSATTPFPQTVQVTSTGGSVPITATFNPVTGGNFVTVASSSGSTPATLTITLNASVASTLAVGSYSGNVVVSSTSLPGGNQTVTVRLTVTAAAPAVLMAITSAASFAPGPVSPGEIVSIFGAQLGPTPGVGFTPDNGRVDTTLAGTVVMFDNVQAPLIYVSASQVNVIVPYEVGSNTFTNITVIRGGTASTPLPVQIAATVPAIFSAFQTGNGQGAILNQNLSANTANNPAPKGSVIAIYATGEGALTPTTQTGTISGPSLPLPKPIANVTVTIGGQPATVSYAGEAPGLVSGVLQVNAMVPTNIASGNQLVVLTIGNNTNITQSITVAVQ